MKYERNMHDCNAYLKLLYFCKGYGYCNYNYEQVVKVKIYVFSFFWSVHLEVYRVCSSSNSQPSYVHPIYPNNFLPKLAR